MTMPDLAHVEWRKSSRSSGSGQCVEVGVWRKSSLSGNGSNRVEIALVSGVPAETASAAGTDSLFLVRDSKDPDGPVLAFTSSEWDAFLVGIKSGDFEESV